jgi:hypothetical protein
MDRRLLPRGRPSNGGGAATRRRRTKEKGAVSRALRCFPVPSFSLARVNLADVAYGQTLGFALTMAPPGPPLYQTLVPTWLLRQYVVAVALKIETFLMPAS